MVSNKLTGNYVSDESTETLPFTQYILGVLVTSVVVDTSRPSTLSTKLKTKLSKKEERFTRET